MWRFGFTGFDFGCMIWVTACELVCCFRGCVIVYVCVALFRFATD